MLTVIGFDTETHLGDGEECPCGERHYTATPKMVCASLSGDASLAQVARETAVALCGEEDVFYHAFKDGTWGMVLTGPMKAMATTTIVSLADIYVAHFAAYDVPVLANENPDWLQTLARDLGYQTDVLRLRCTQIREQSIATALDTFYGRTFSLAECVQNRLNIDISASKKGEDAWRLNYATLDGQAATRWPEAALEYALMDAVYARLVYLSQARPLSVSGHPVVNAQGDVMAELMNTRVGVAVLAWARTRGIEVDPGKTQHWVAEVEAEVAKGQEFAKGLGIWRINRCDACDGTGYLGSYPDLNVCTTCWCSDHETCLARGTYKKKAAGNIGTESTKAKQAMVTWMYNGRPPMTDPSTKFPNGQVKTDTDTFGEGLNTTPLIKQYVDTLFAKKQLSTYVPPTLAAAATPNRTLFSWPNAIVTTNRTSWQKPNLTNPPRKGEYRECHVPRDGMVMASLDFSSNELRTHAQYNIDNFGFSVMGDVLNDPAGDVYLHFAANTMGIPLEEARRLKDEGDKVVKKNRQTHKIAVLGYPGGLGADSFIGYARGYDLVVDKETATRLKQDWRETYPEMGLHLDRIGELSRLAGGGRFTMVDKRTGWVKGGCDFCSAANFTFQCPGAGVLKSAAWECWVGCHIDPTSEMYGRAHILILIHDEILFEGDEETAHLWAPEGARRMVAAAEKLTPDVKHFVEPALMRRWLKAAEPVYVDGRLVPWEPKEKTT